jgi:hypothetical protein
MGRNPKKLRKIEIPASVSYFQAGKVLTEDVGNNNSIGYGAGLPRRSFGWHTAPI